MMIMRAGKDVEIIEGNFNNDKKYYNYDGMIYILYASKYSHYMYQIS